ncbi:MAG: hypothetical protein A3F43_00625 [Gammaproteobacteria bacterium RIFCSPHIGHO2_12_FULL_42_10]|nr:MAG: hypothetical protein A3F43_00625 [Gammaproteobacteria bacterium RIFCSPHIGHO2_12_FULL_42_10]
MNETSLVLPIKTTLSVAYTKTVGSKKIFLAAAAMILLLGFAMGLISGITYSFSHLASSLINVLGRLIVTILQAGLLYLGILRARDASIHYSQVFRSFERRIALGIIGVYLIQFLIFTAILVIFVFLPVLWYSNLADSAVQAHHVLIHIAWTIWVVIGSMILLFLIMRMLFARGLVIDRAMGPWRATCVSFHATRGNVLRLLLLVCCQMGALMMGAILLLVGLIWAIPFAVMIYGVAYNTLLSNTDLKIRTASSI